MNAAKTHAAESVEAIVSKTAVKPLNLYPCTLMNDHQSETLMSCMLADPEKLKELSADMEAKGNFLWMVFTKRAKSMGLDLELKLVAFVVFGLLENPAMSTQIVHCIYHAAKKKGTLEQQFTLNDFVMVFANGFPAESSYEKAWHEQKRDCTHGGSDNMLDTDLFAAVWQASK